MYALELTPDSFLSMYQRWPVCNKYLINRIIFYEYDFDIQLVTAFVVQFLSQNMLFRFMFSKVMHIFQTHLKVLKI